MLESTNNLASADLTLSDITAGFEIADSTEVSKWVIEDANQDGSTWGLYYDTTGIAYNGNFFIGYSYNSANSADDWLISSCIDMQAGAKYEFCCDLGSDINYPEKMVVMLGL